MAFRRRPKQLNLKRLDPVPYPSMPLLEDGERDGFLAMWSACTGFKNIKLTIVSEQSKFRQVAALLNATIPYLRCQCKL